MHLVEYLYVDEPRLDSYLQQFASPLTHDQVPIWTADISFAGVRISRSRSVVSRSRTQHEKIQALLDHLRRSPYYATSRPIRISDPIDNKITVVFYHETVTAEKVIVPARKGVKASRALSIWLVSDEYAYRPPSTGLALLEDYPHSDVPGGTGITAYSALQFLLMFLSKELRRTVANPESIVELARSPGMIERGGVIGPDRRDLDVLSVLAKLNCLALEPRRVEVLYRVRAHGHNYAQIFGYPIFIAEAPE